MTAPDDNQSPEPAPVPRRRGRPPGSKNKSSIAQADAAPATAPGPEPETAPKRRARSTTSQSSAKAAAAPAEQAAEQAAAPAPSPAPEQEQRPQIKRERWSEGKEARASKEQQNQKGWQKKQKGKFNKNNHNNQARHDRGEKGDRGDRQDRQERQDRNQQGNNKQQRGKFNKAQKNKQNGAGNNQQHQQQQRAYVPIGEPEEHTGLLIITPKNYGFVRELGGTATPVEDAVYVPADLIAEHHLRPYVQITGMAQKFERGHQMVSITAVNGLPPEEAAALPHFDELKAVNPSHRLAFETEPSRYTTRTLDLVAPVARGQRGLIVAPPRTGKTTLLMHIAEAVQENYSDDMHLMILLVDERPEEVTEFKRCLPQAEVFASSNDSKVREHCQTAEICIERAKRLVEGGKHVLLLLDSITRLARAYNNDQRGSGRTMSGGIDARALEIPRRLFAAARNTRTAGSLTILATALIETNSRMDDLIFQEFKGTGNMELVLNRRIAEMYIYPAVDILKSGTRREELILSEMSLEKVRLIRRALAGHKPVEAMERLLFFLRKYKNNAQMLLDLKSR